MSSFRSHQRVSAFAAVLLAACGSAQDPSSASQLGGKSGITITTDQLSYPQGARVGLLIQNHGAVQLAYNACTRQLEVRDGIAWVPGPESLRLCSREVWWVKPGESRVDSTDLDWGLMTGEYRMVIGFTTSGLSPDRNIRVATNSFTIEP